MTEDFLSLEDVVHKIEACNSGEALWQLAIEIFAARGLHRISYFHFPPLGAHDQGKITVVAHGYPEDQIREYIRNKTFLIDPRPTAALNSAEPLYWSETGEAMHLNKDQAELMEQREEHSSAEGIGIQVFGPQQRNGYFAFSLDKLRQKIDLMKLREIQWICQTLHLRYCHIVQMHQPEMPRLSAREVEILEWVARGKSNSVIAQIMGLSTHTVDAYLRRIFLKLGATDRITATVKGIGRGVIRGITPKKPEAPELKSA